MLQNKKNAQLAHFITKGCGQVYDCHRLYALMGVAGNLSYYFARSSKIEVQDLIVSQEELFFAAELSFAENKCGVIVVQDRTNRPQYEGDQRDFEPGFTPYAISMHYYPDACIADSSLVQETSILKGRVVSDYFWIKQDEPFSKVMPVLLELRNFKDAFESNIHQKYDHNFKVALLL